MKKNRSLRKTSNLPRRRQGGFLRGIASHLGAAYMGYRAPSILSKAKQTVLGALNKLPPVRKYREMTKNKAQNEMLSKNAQIGKDQYNAIKNMKYNPFGTKQEQIDQGTQGTFKFKDSTGKQQVFPRDMTVDTAAEVKPMHQISADFARQRGIKVTPASQAPKVFNVYEDALTGQGKRKRKGRGKTQTKRLKY